MRPLFPAFKKLSLNDKSIIERYTKSFPPYSDYYFFSLWSYNTENSISYTILHNNLVVKFQEYSGDGYFYSFIGRNKIEHTVAELITLAHRHRLPAVLKLVPEECIALEAIQTLGETFSFVEDEDNFDYILSVEKIALMRGAKLHQKKKQLKKFLRSYDYYVKYCSLPNRKVHMDILAILYKWYSQTKEERAKNECEVRAIQRTLRYASHFSLVAACVYVDNKIRGFTIFEQVNSKYAILSFQKADKEYEGIFEFLNFSVAQYLHKKGCMYMNIEQDLGIPGLRQAKRKYDPSFLKKYSIFPKQP